MNVAIQIPDEVGRALTGQGRRPLARRPRGGCQGRYRSGTITPAQVQEMLGLRSRSEVESFLQEAKAHLDYTMDDLDRDIAEIRSAGRQ